MMITAQHAEGMAIWSAATDALDHSTSSVLILP
jgi:hypothetical protein